MSYGPVCLIVQKYSTFKNCLSIFIKTRLYKIGTQKIFVEKTETLTRFIYIFTTNNDLQIMMSQKTQKQTKNKQNTQKRNPDKIRHVCIFNGLVQLKKKNPKRNF